jgi:hypothetical protein
MEYRDFLENKPIQESRVKTKPQLLLEFFYCQSMFIFAPLISCDEYFNADKVFSKRT